PYYARSGRQVPFDRWIGEAGCVEAALRLHRLTEARTERARVGVRMLTPHRTCRLPHTGVLATAVRSAPASERFPRVTTSIWRGGDHSLVSPTRCDSPRASGRVR